jgi:hypothetical protein
MRVVAPRVHRKRPEIRVVGGQISDCPPQAIVNFLKLEVRSADGRSNVSVQTSQTAV